MSTTAPRTAVVTGAAGFLGSHLTDRLLTEGWRVTGMDNFLTGSPRNIAHLRDTPAFAFRQCDVTEPFTVAGPVDFVFHFASPASPIHYQRCPVETLKAGSLGTHHSLELAREKGAGFLVASTSEIYGDPAVHPQTEDYWGNVNSTGPRSCYDEAKRYAEAATMAWHRAHGVPTHIVRIFNTYGPRMDLADGRVVPAFIGQALRGEPLTIFGDGSQTRSFCYVSDLIDGIYRLSQSREHLPVNIGNPHEMTIRQFADAILSLVDTPSAIEHRELPVDDPKQRRPDISRAKALLGWEPRVSFADGIRETISYFLGVLGSEARCRLKPPAVS